MFHGFGRGGLHNLNRGLGSLVDLPVASRKPKNNTVVRTSPLFSDVGNPINQLGVCVNPLCHYS